MSPVQATSIGAGAGQSREIEQLKKLLFESESARLELLRANVDALQRYVGTPDRLEVATAEILVAAFHRAEIERPSALAAAIAPSVVTAIRSEIRNSREMMVEALYPIIGRLVSAAVAHAFKNVVASVERSINALTSVDVWLGQVKSLMTGRPLSQFVLADNDHLSVRRLMVIERGTGRLVSDWKSDGTTEERADLLSGMIAAILDFSVQALAGEGKLRTLDFGGREIVLRASPQTILAAECVGTLRPRDDTKINALFYDLVEAIDGGGKCNEAMLATLAESIEGSQTPDRDANRRGRIILQAALAVCAAALVWLGAIWEMHHMLEQRTQAVLAQIIQRQPSLTAFPLRLEFDHGARSLTIAGIEPDQVNTQMLLRDLGEVVAPYQIVDRIGILPSVAGSAALRENVSVLGRNIAEEARIRAEQSAQLRAGVDTLVHQSAQIQRGLAEEARTRAEQSAALRAGVDTLAHTAADTQRELADEERMRAEQLAALRAGVDTLARAAADTQRELADEERTRAEQLAALRAGVDSLAHTEADAQQALIGEAQTRAEQTAALRASIDALARAAAETRHGLAEEARARGVQFGELESVVNGPSARLDRFIESTAVFFGYADEFIDGQAARRQLEELAGLLSNNTLKVRIVGHADETGSVAANRILAHRRAEQVMRTLTKLGVDADRLFVVSRSTSVPIVDSVTPLITGNRRVTFENVFRGELRH